MFISKVVCHICIICLKIVFSQVVKISKEILYFVEIEYNPLLFFIKNKKTWVTFNTYNGGIIALIT